MKAVRVVVEFNIEVADSEDDDELGELYVEFVPDALSFVVDEEPLDATLISFETLSAEVHEMADASDSPD